MRVAALPVPPLPPLALPLLALLATPVLAQSSPISAPVIAQCNETASASDLPNCLKEGAIAYEMLDLARSEDFYGEAAEPVIAICGERNDTFHKQWICFSNAAAKAAETRELIGQENIADTCVAAISDPSLTPRLDEEYGKRRAERFPDQRYYGGEMFYPFQRCPVPVEGAGSPETPRDLAAEAGGSGGSASPAAAEVVDADIFSPEGCAALGEIRTLIRDSDAETLRSIGARVSALGDGPTASDLAEATGLSQTTTQVFASDPQTGTGIAMAVGAFMETSHPELLEEFFAEAQSRAGTPAGGPGDEIAKAMLAAFMASAREQYDGRCGAE